MGRGTRPVRRGDPASTVRCCAEERGATKPALAEDDAYLRELGASEILDRTADLKAAIRERYPDGVDAILDLVSYTPQDALLREGGRLASPLGAAGEGSGRFNLMAQPTPRTCSGLPSSSTVVRFEFGFRGARRSSRRARRSRRSPRRTRKASSA